jgi:hypothetical protein
VKQHHGAFVARAGTILVLSIVASGLLFYQAMRYAFAEAFEIAVQFIAPAFSSEATSVDEE